MRTRRPISRAIWRQAQPLAATPAEAYLEARGLAAAQLPPTLRYLPPRPRAKPSWWRRMIGTALGAAIRCGPAAATMRVAEGLESGCRLAPCSPCRTGPLPAPNACPLSPCRRSSDPS
ncbi:DUF7146 domain-containing protein, partial [Bradyrhizobium brasilense]|uniref:DUF7146 domain-containing protein n=1 Tax=Bradyrhizobium brasilense TaxID=1419277 RepID=UPI003D321DB4